MYRRTIPLLSILISAGAILAAQDFTPLAGAVKTVYPAHQHFAVVCDYGFSHEAVDRLAAVLGSGARLTVVDMRNGNEATRAQTALRIAGADLLVLMPKDRLVCDGSPYASAIAHGVADRMPTVGTTRAALSNGAAFAIGPETGNELLVNPEWKGVVGPPMPLPVERIGTHRGSATLSVVRVR